MMADLVTNAEVQQYLNTTEDYSEEITRASTIVTQILGNPVIHEELTEFHDGGYQAIFTNHYPIVPGSVTVLDTETAEEADPLTYRVHNKGRRILRRRNIWSMGVMRWEITYTAGLAATVEEVPADIKKAVLMLIADEVSGTTEGMKKETIGDYSYEKFDSDAARQGVLGQVERLLAPRIRAVRFI